MWSCTFLDHKTRTFDTAKLSLFKSVFVATLTYGHESWAADWKNVISTNTRQRWRFPKSSWRNAGWERAQLQISEALNGRSNHPDRKIPATIIWPRKQNAQRRVGEVGPANYHTHETTPQKTTKGQVEWLHPWCGSVASWFGVSRTVSRGCRNPWSASRLPRAPCNLPRRKPRFENERMNECIARKQLHFQWKTYRLAAISCLTWTHYWHEAWQVTQEMKTIVWLCVRFEFDMFHFFLPCTEWFFSYQGLSSKSSSLLTLRSFRRHLTL